MIRNLTIIIFLSIIFIYTQSCKIDKTSLSSMNNELEQQSPFNLSCERTELDIDSNSVIDYVIEYSALQTTDVPPSSINLSLGIVPQDSNQIYFIENEGSLPLNFGTPINNNLEWSEYSSNLAWIHWRISSGWDSVWTGSWSGVEGKFLAVKFMIDSSFHFGWLKLSVDLITGEYIIFDHSFNMSAGEEIKAGFR